VNKENNCQSASARGETCDARSHRGACNSSDVSYSEQMNENKLHRKARAHCGSVASDENEILIKVSNSGNCF